MRSIRWLSVIALGSLALIFVSRLLDGRPSDRGAPDPAGARDPSPAGAPPLSSAPVVEVDVRSTHPILAREPEDTGAAVVLQHVRPGRIAVDVVDEDGRTVSDAWIVPIDCPGFTSAAPGEYAVALGPCALVARRLDGALIARSAPVMVVVRGEEPARVVLELPSRRTGGIGIRFQPDGEGMRVVEVVPGTPAEAAGLEPGDVILAVGDDPVAGMDADQFVSTMTGDEGTVVEFTVKLPSDTGLAEQTVRVTRAYLEG